MAPTSPQVPIEPTTPTEPTEPTEPTGPTDPTEPIEPDDPEAPEEPSNAGNLLGAPKKKKKSKPKPAGPPKDKCAVFPTDDAATEPKLQRAVALVGFDRMDVPSAKKVTAEEALRWIYLATNWRFAGVYLQGTPPTGVKVPSSTDITKHDRQWMSTFAALEHAGFGTAPLFLAVSNHHGLGKPRVTMDAALGKQHGLYARSLAQQLVDQLGIDMTGCVVYIDNEDVGGEQVYDKECRLKESKRADYLAYHEAIATELMRPRDGAAFRVGLYTHPAVIQVLSAAMPEMYAWVVQQPKKQKWSSILTEDEEDAPLSVHVSLDNTPKHQRLDAAPKLMWPVLRQFALDIAIEQSVKPPLSMSVDLSGSYAFDPSDPIASPRLAYVPTSTMLLRNRVRPATYSGTHTKFKQATQSAVRQGEITVFEGGTSIQQAIATLTMPLNHDGEEIHPESPMLAAVDGNARSYAGAVRRDRRILIGQIEVGKSSLMEEVPDSFVRRPFAAAIVGLQTQIIVVWLGRANRWNLSAKVWPFGKWFHEDGYVDIHPLSGFAASSFASGKNLFFCGVSISGEMYALHGELLLSSNAMPTFSRESYSGSPPKLCVTSAVAAVSPTDDDHLAFAISLRGTLVCYWVNLNTSKTGFLESGRLLHLHSQLGAVVESKDRVHAAGIDVDGNVRRWVFRRSGSGWDWDGDSVAPTQGTAGAPNPYSDVTLASTGRDLGFVAVAGVDDTDDAPATRTRAFRASFGDKSWTAIANS